MCEANVYMEQNGKEELLPASVDVIEPQAAGALRMVNIFGGQKISGALLEHGPVSSRKDRRPP